MNIATPPVKRHVGPVRIFFGFIFDSVDFCNGFRFDGMKISILSPPYVGSQKCVEHACFHPHHFAQKFPGFLWAFFFSKKRCRFFPLAKPGEVEFLTPGVAVEIGGVVELEAPVVGFLRVPGWNQGEGVTGES